MSASRDAGNRSPSGSEGVTDRLANYLRAAAAGVASLLRGQRAVELLTALTLIGGGLLIMAEFLDLYRIERGAVVVQQQTGGEHHSYALLVAGLAVIGAALLARATDAWPPAAAACGIGLAALALALVGDLPDATSSGLTADVHLAEANPAVGFWVEVVGASLTIASGALLAFKLRQ
jgi:hypothetical protein